MSTNIHQSKALIALGGNIGDAVRSIDRAMTILGENAKIELLDRSSLYTTLPVGSDAGETFINAAVTVRTSLSAVQLLEELHQVENDFGRVREKHWGPRVIDLDLILFGDKIIQSEQIRVPHPACFYRRFVLDPAIEIAGDWKHPVFGETLTSLLAKLLQRPLQVSVCGDEQLLRNLQENSDERFQFKSEPDSSAVIIFDRSDEINLPQTISLADQTEPLEFIEQILIAATDEPRKI